MADTKILPRQLPANSTPPSGAVTIVDDGTSVNKTTLAQLGDAIGAVRSIGAGTNVSVDVTDPLNPIINAVGSGDMLASMYDPDGVQSNAFDMQNMEDGTTKVAMTSTERSKLAGIAAGAQVNTVNTVNGYTGAVVLTKADVGLGDVDNTSDANKPISISTQTALDDKADKSITIGVGEGLAGGGTLEVDRSIALNAASIASIALANTAVQSVAGKLGPAVTLNSIDVGLGNVDNTSDLAKPISTATQTALSAKANSSITITASTGLTGGGNLTANRTVALNAASIASLSLADSAIQPAGMTKAAVGLGNVDNTSDANKPVSTAQQTALNLKANNATNFTAGTGLTGGGTLSANRTFALSTTSIASLAKADSAIQSADLGTLAFKNLVAMDDLDTTGIASSGSVLFGDGEWRILEGGGDMLSSIYDPQNIAADAFARANHTGTQPASTITGLTKASVGLSNVDNTSDLGKPISTATQAALNGKASTAVATASSNGLMSSAQFSKLSGIEPGAQVNPGLSTASSDGLMSSAQFTKLAGIATGATANVGTVTSVGVSVPTGFAASGAVTSSGNINITYSAGYQGFTTAESTKLAGIAAGAQVNTVNSVAGKTGAVTLVKGDVGLGNVDNTSDVNKPVSVATQNELNAKISKTDIVALKGGSYAYMKYDNYEVIHGTIVGTPNAQGEIFVTFPISLSAPPIALTSGGTSGSYATFLPVANSYSSTGFTVIVYGPNGSVLTSGGRRMNYTAFVIGA